MPKIKKRTQQLSHFDKNVSRGGMVFFFTSTILAFYKVLFLFLSNIFTAPFSPDSWAYLDISRSLFNNFYYVSNIRQFEVFSHYSTSFPPLFPLLISVFNYFFNKGIYAGYFINFLCLILIFISFTQLSKVITTLRSPAIVLFFVFLTNNDFLKELLGGRSIVLSLLLLSTLVFIFIRGEVTKQKIMSISFLAGLLTLNRFDFLLPGLMLGIILLFNTNISRVKTIALYYIIFFLTLSPWIVYSLNHFGRFFMSDNVRTVMLSFRTSTMDFFPNSKEIITFFDNPKKWIVYRFFFIGILSFISFIKSVYENEFVFLLLKVLGILLLILGNITSRTQLKIKVMSSQRREVLKKLLILAPLFLIQLFAISLTGFLDLRYSLFLLFYVVLLLISGASILLEMLVNKTYFILTIIFFIIMTSSGTLFFNLPQDIHFLLKQKISLNQSYLIPDQRSQQILDEIKKDNSVQPLLIDESQNDKINPSQFAALTHMQTLETPSNNNAYVLIKVIEKYNVGYIYTGCEYWLDTINSHFNIATTSAEHLYKIEGISNKSTQAEPEYSVKQDERYKSCGKYHEGLD